MKNQKTAKEQYNQAYRHARLIASFTDSTTLVKDMRSVGINPNIAWLAYVSWRTV